MSFEVTLLVGGRSTEHDASLHGYHHVLHELLNEPDRVTVDSVFYLDRAGAVRVFRGAPWPETEEDLRAGSPLSLGEAVAELASAGSFVFSLLHGNEGEDGGWQGLAEVFGIRGNFGPALASSLGMDKYLQATLATALVPGLRLPRSVLVRTERFDAPRVLTEAGSGPLVVKPNRMGASLLTTRLDDATEQVLTEAVEAAAPYDDQVLVQEFIGGREYSCSVYRENGSLVDLPVVEVVAQGFFGHEEKHVKGRARLVLCEEEATTKTIRDMSQELFEAAGVATFARFDFIVRNGEFYFLEVNTLPGLMSGSIFPMALTATGRSITDLVVSAANEYDGRPHRNKFKQYDIGH
ncbi:D-alanine--D-alanine ligase family protein [Streptomyces sp. H34-S4]|uniref:D-alanine--D-alanine ligase family protein n=1 Tax=Streptomyces sp. H34-S4 TaxID=2996463 RepID=UPI002271BC3C|nr:ATP-grasp domain-containing protein [Streptomyces sp. H34-S4]MCY0939509.1 ATP-grasp domain-containing protein [Streptomyces sp. H34-S4]